MLNKESTYSERFIHPTVLFDKGMKILQIVSAPARAFNSTVTENHYIKVPVNYKMRAVEIDVI